MVAAGHSEIVGILGYQGCIEPHEAIFQKLTVPCRRVRTPEELASVGRLILPGGESTTMLKFLSLHSMLKPIQDFAKTKPVWGICAGAILAAHEVSNPAQESLQLIEIAAHRNFYGSQLDSFSASVRIDVVGKAVQAQFIRAPVLSPLPTAASSEPPVCIGGYHEGKPVFLSQGRVWACSFHVELGTDTSLHERFLEL